MLYLLPFSCSVPPSPVVVVQAESETENVKEKPLLSSKGSAKNTVQIYPQEVKVTLRPKNPAKFKIQFRQAEDYPVDLYYLMDLSNSMKDDKEKLADLGERGRRGDGNGAMMR